MGLLHRIQQRHRLMSKTGPSLQEYRLDSPIACSVPRATPNRRAAGRPRTACRFPSTPLHRGRSPRVVIEGRAVGMATGAAREMAAEEVAARVGVEWVVGEMAEECLVAGEPG